MKVKDVHQDEIKTEKHPHVSHVPHVNFFINNILRRPIDLWSLARDRSV